MRRLNGWHRIGIVLSVIWLPIGFFSASGQAIDDSTAEITQRLKICLATDGGEYGPCNAAFANSWAAAVENSHHWFWGVVFAIVPVVLCWLFALGTIAIVRWIVDGFKTA